VRGVFFVFVLFIGPCCVVCRRLCVGCGGEEAGRGGEKKNIRKERDTNKKGKSTYRSRAWNVSRSRFRF
jgi:hypothetical protein